jgi:hypothetical protein
MMKFILARHGTRVRELDPVAEKYIEKHLGLNEDRPAPSAPGRPRLPGDAGDTAALQLPRRAPAAGLSPHQSSTRIARSSSGVSRSREYTARV